MNPAPARILVVEDEGIIAQDIKATLEKLGYAVPAIAVVGEEAIEKAIELKPDLVLMDIALWGGMDGVTAAGQIRQHLDIPIVFLTAHSDHATLQRAKEAGPYGYLVKPLVERELRIGLEMALHKHATDQRLAAQDKWYATTLASIGEAVIATNADGAVRYMNPLAETITGWRQAEAAGQHLDTIMALSAEVAPGGSHGPFAQAVSQGLVIDWANRTSLWSRQGLSTPIDYTATCIRQADGTVAGVVVVFRDITPRRQMEDERERLIHELRAALDNVKTLRGLLPICASCKKIRDDEGYWSAVDAYVIKQGLGEVSHGICPDCLRKLYPEFAEEIIAEVAEKENRRAAQLPATPPA